MGKTGRKLPVHFVTTKAGALRAGAGDVKKNKEKIKTQTVKKNLKGI